MSESIKRLFVENQEIIQLIDLAVSNFRVQNYDKALRNGLKILDKFAKIVPLYAEEAEHLNATGAVQIDISYINEMLTGIMNTQESMDYVLLSDLYELQLGAYVAEVQQAVFMCLDENDLIGSEGVDEHYQIELCTNGEYTLAKEVDGNRFYLHSNHKPIFSACELAKSWYQEEKTKYVIFGFGLGYHAYQLGELDETVEIIVFESDEHVIELSEKYGVKEAFLKNKRHKLIYDKNQTKLLDALSQLNENGNFVIHYPSLQVLEASDIKKKLENYFIQYSSVANQSSLMTGNFRENKIHVPSPVHTIKKEWEGKTAYIVAAGPSLDYNFKELKRVDKKNSIIIAVGTVFHKMIKEGIPIDYVVISEANERTLGQIRGNETSEVPLILLSTANHKFAKEYRGPKYLVYQEGFPLAEDAAEEESGFTCEVGGSVSTLALDLSVKMGCKKVVTVGLDLAYTNNYVHALDTSRRNISDVKNLRVIVDMYGKEVYTTRSMDKYREWIENWITKVKDVEFYNATEGGANIKGMQNVLLKEVIE